MTQVTHDGWRDVKNDDNNGDCVKWVGKTLIQAQKEINVSPWGSHGHRGIDLGADALGLSALIIEEGSILPKYISCLALVNVLTLSR